MQAFLCILFVGVKTKFAPDCDGDDCADRCYCQQNNGEGKLIILEEITHACSKYEAIT